MQIRKVDTENQQDIQKFVQFPHDLYEGCLQWVPRLRSGVRNALNRTQNPFYRHSTADFFLAEEGDKTLGRINVLIHKHYNDYHGTKTAFFYYFDVVNDHEVSQGLLDAACAWAREREMDTLIGPKSMLRADGLGMLLEGFEYRAAPGMPYNYAYYNTLMEAAGFEKEMDHLSGYLTGDYEMPERYHRIAERVKERSGFWIKSFQSKRELRRWVPHVQRLFNEASTQVWGYYPLDEAETELSGKQLLTIADPRTMKFVMQGDDVIGYIFVYPDVSPALQATGGRLWPFGWIRLLYELKTTRVMSGNGVGLLPEYHGLGATALLYIELYKTLKAKNATFCDVAQIAESNIKSMGEMKSINVQWYKRHRTYRKPL
jgi:hypothetical protein